MIGIHLYPFWHYDTKKVLKFRIDRHEIGCIYIYLYTYNSDWRVRTPFGNFRSDALVCDTEKNVNFEYTFELTEHIRVFLGRMRCLYRRIYTAATENSQIYPKISITA